MARDSLADRIQSGIGFDPRRLVRAGIGAVSGAIVGRATGRSKTTTTILSLGGGIVGAAAPEIGRFLSQPILSGRIGFGTTRGRTRIFGL